jgi:hypothetical protein
MHQVTCTGAHYPDVYQRGTRAKRQGFGEYQSQQGGIKIMIE